MIKVLVVDDHARMRKSIRMLLERSGEITVVGEADEGKQALLKIRQLQPDLVVLDISMPGMNGFDVLDALSLQEEAPLVIMLSMNDSSDLIRRALKNGAADFVSKNEASLRLLPAIRRAAHGGGSGGGGSGNPLLGLVGWLALP